MWVGRAVASLPGLAPRSLEDALCNESDGVYLSEQERVPPPPRAAKDGMGVSGRAGEGRAEMRVKQSALRRADP